MKQDKGKYTLEYIQGLIQKAIPELVMGRLSKEHRAELRKDVEAFADYLIKERGACGLLAN